MQTVIQYQLQDLPLIQPDIAEVCWQCMMELPEEMRPEGSTLGVHRALADTLMCLGIVQTVAEVTPLFK